MLEEDGGARLAVLCGGCHDEQSEQATTTAHPSFQSGIAVVNESKRMGQHRQAVRNAFK